MRGASLAYAIRHVTGEARPWQVVHVPTGLASFRSRYRRDADAELERVRAISSRPAPTEAELNALCASLNSTAGQW